MKLLLDTHALFWWWIDSPRLPESARGAIFESDIVIVSAASVWEIATKQRLLKLQELARGIGDLLPFCHVQGFDLLSISPAHAQRAGSYPHRHGDPFDRMLAAQAELENLVLLTKDDKVRDFPCATRW